MAADRTWRTVSQVRSAEAGGGMQQDRAGARGRRVVLTSAPGFVPVEANLHRPRLRDGLVARGELVDTLREHSHLPVVLVTAPPGFGKTTLLAQWDDEDERPFTWLSLDQSSNDATVLVTYVMLALQRLGLVDAGVLSALADRSEMSTVLLPRLGRMLAHHGEPFVLVLDDAEQLSSPEALDVLEMVVRHLNEGSQIAIAARVPPRLPWSQWRAERRLLAIGADELRLSLTEARALLSAVGVEVSDEDTQALLERTEGWPAGFYLAALSLRQAAQRRDPVSAAVGRDGVLAGYLRDELFAALPADQREFLVRTSVLSRMSAPLCDAVLRTSGSGDVLRQLERSNLFVVPLDGHEQWYRYHNLFADMLHAELATEDEALVTALHARASRWLEAEGDVDEAVRHAQAAHEVERAARLVWSQAATYLATGHGATLRRWLEGFTSEQVVQHTKLALTAAWCAVDAGRPVDHWIAAAEHGRYDASRPEEPQAVASAIALVHAYRARDGVVRMREDADRALRLQAPDDPWRPLAQYLAAVSVLLGGDPDDASGQLRATELFAEAMQLPGHQLLCAVQLALLASEAGAWDDTTRLVGSAAHLAADSHLDDAPPLVLLQCLRCLVLAQRGYTDEARHLAQRCLRIIATVTQAPPWLAIQTRYVLARAQLLMGDSAAARVLLSEAQTQLKVTPDARWLAERLAEAWNHVEQFPLATGVGPSALTSAELRVLQLLPTHLSFEQIGERLNVSRNTVKTQAIAAYRKLGVSSRAEAVERARSLGMVATP